MQQFNEQQQDEKFDRGTDLSLFASDRQEDWFALIIALAIAMGIVFFIAL